MKLDTLEKFLVVLRATHRRTPFQLDGMRIRTADGFCPVCAVGQTVGRNRHLREESSIIGPLLRLSRDLADDLGLAADSPYPGVSEYARELNELRQQLLAACGLPDDTTTTPRRKPPCPWHGPQFRDKRK